jgi:hypothetical protein
VIDIVEDRRRHISDSDINNKEATTVDPVSEQLVMRKWADIRVSDEKV